jgi:hypothetical protein
MNVTRCAIPLLASAPLPSQGGYTSQVARILSPSSSQAGSERAKPLQTPFRTPRTGRSFQSVDGACRGCELCVAALLISSCIREGCSVHIMFTYVAGCRQPSKVPAALLACLINFLSYILHKRLHSLSKLRPHSLSHEQLSVIVPI